MVNSYRICGLSVASDIGLPGLIAGEPKSVPQVTIRRGIVPEALQGASAIGPTWQIAGKRFLLSVPNVARFLLQDGNEIVFAPDSEESLADVPVFVLGTAFGILLHQREQIVLHASAIEVNGRAVVFCGPSGAGKSTLAAAFAQQGYRLITDDVCAIALSADAAPIVHPDGRHLKLWAQAIDKLELSSFRREPVRGCLEKFYVELSDAASAALPLAAIYALRDVLHTDDLSIERPSAVDSAMLLRCNAYRPLLVSRLDQKAHYFHAAAPIINQSGIFALTRPWGFDAMPGIMVTLERHWRDIGIAQEKVA